MLLKLLAFQTSNKDPLGHFLPVVKGSAHTLVPFNPDGSRSRLDRFKSVSVEVFHFSVHTSFEKQIIQAKKRVSLIKSAIISYNLPLEERPLESVVWKMVPGKEYYSISVGFRRI